MRHRIEETFVPWLNRTVDAMLPYLPSPSPCFQPFGPTSIPPPLYELCEVPGANGNTVHALEEGDAVDTVLPDRTARLSLADDRLRDRQEVMEEGTTWARLRKNKRVTPEDWWQDVREIEFEIEDPQ
jgi:hypothetical protein